MWWRKVERLRFELHLVELSSILVSLDGSSLGNPSGANIVACSTLEMPSVPFYFQIFMQITELPFSLYSTFVIEARHGFNKVCILAWIFFVSALYASILFWHAISAFESLDYSFACSANTTAILLGHAQRNHPFYLTWTPNCGCTHCNNTG
ncbi:hypothetical protein HHK36_000161 [Tetracentron sinense]|uniref:CAAX prenyl protease 1 N-terminal domain-containing protein n=1 Tax=Tetracentron sinense TaxID=13715 RepID=A0A835DQJ8_TETSI|nr:hypothetical protein HHK36_000161 [Tetracentron sinense]